MQYFWDWAVRPLLKNRRVRTVLEIGASQGGNTDRVLRCFPDIHITIVDPCLDTDLAAKYRGQQAVEVRVGRSLEVLPQMDGCFDAILIDGDHNYYTVINELRLIASRKLVAPGGMILFHDVGQPWAYRDMFYEPEQVPAEAKAPGKPQGVLTAVKTFREESPRCWIWLKWNAEHGLGCLAEPRSGFDKYSLWLKTWSWQSIRWRNRILRLLGLRQHDAIRWGRQGQAVPQESSNPQ